MFYIGIGLLLNNINNIPKQIFPSIFNQIECRSNNREFWRIINLFHFEPANIYLLYR